MAQEANLPTVTDPNALVALEKLTPAEVEQARQVAAGLDVNDSLAITSFAVQAQREMGGVTDPILKMVTTKDAGPAGTALTNLLEQVRVLNASSLAGQAESVLASLPGLGPLFSKARAFISRYETVARKIDRIVVELESAKRTMLRDIATLDQLYAQNLQLYRSLLVYIAAGEIKITELQKEHAALVERASASGDPALAQQASDLGNLITRLERRVYDLKLTAMIALQSGPQIRLVQNGDQSLVEKIQSSILLTIPLWKRQIIIAIALFDQKKAIQLQRAVSGTTNELLQQNAALLRQGTAEAARESERGIAEIETLVKVNDELIATIEEAIQIQQEGRQKRIAAEAQLAAMQQQLKETLTRARSLRPGA
ncbi:MAG: toxic anion resistance protein [Anaerolineae bacterium]